MQQHAPGDRILAFLANHAHRTYRPKELSRKLGISDNTEYKRFRVDLKALIDDRKIDVHKGGRVQHKRASTTPVGRITIHPRGFGFVSVDDYAEDIYVSASNTGTALDGDRVRVEVLARDRRGPRRGRGMEGEVVEIVERERTQAVGTFRSRGKLGYVEPDDQRLTRDIYVDETSGARDGDKVVATIDRFEHHRGSPEGRVVQVIGPGTDPVVRVSSLAMSLGVRLDYPEGADREANVNALRGVPIPEDVIRSRLDLRRLQTVTIDPDDAKDFDDAISVELLPSKGYRVSVHVADVSHYVDVGSELDREAFARGTSAYLVDRVVPMLPEVLSAEVCSLRPNEEKLAMSCIVEMDSNLETLSIDIRETVIESDFRLTYEEAQLIIAGQSHAAGPMIEHAALIARALRRRRTESGSIEFDLPEVKVVLDAEGTAVDVRPRERLEAHRLIEELMLLANGTVAGWMKAQDFVYRVHAAPDADRLGQVAQYVSLFGYDLKLSDGFARPEQINNLLTEIRGTPQEAVIQSALLRAMSKAVYSTENIGHYGLAIEHYTHFTSPIRRYPDLMVHRLLKSRLHRKRAAEEVSPTTLQEAARHCSDRERLAVEAERASIKMKQVEYAANHLGDTFAGVISGVSQFGVFVQMTDLLVEGMVHVRDIGDDFYEYDETTYSLVGTRSGRVFQVGQLVTVTIVRADTEAREIDLFFADAKRRS